MEALLFATNILKTIFIIFKTMLLNSLLASLYLHPWWSLAPGTWHSYNTCSNRLILRAQEKALWSSDDHLKRFHHKANDSSILLPVEAPSNHQPFFISLWYLSNISSNILRNIPRNAGQADGTTSRCQYSLHFSHLARLIIPYTPMDQLLKKQEVGALQWLLLEDRSHSLKC